MCQKNTLAEFCCSVTAKQEKTQMSQQQLGGFTSRWCNSFLCFTSFVRPHRRTGASCSLAFWERPYTEERIPPAHVITLYITSLRMPPSCVCIRVCVSMLSGAIGISRKWQNWWSGTTQRRREIAGLNQQTVTVCAYVCEWEWKNEWDNVHKNPLVPLAFAVSALSRDRTSHVRFHYGCQFLLHSLNAAFGATAGSFCSNWVRVSLQWLFFLSIFFFLKSLISTVRKILRCPEGNPTFGPTVGSSGYNTLMSAAWAVWKN